MTEKLALNLRETMTLWINRARRSGPKKPETAIPDPQKPETAQILRDMARFALIEKDEIEMPESNLKKQSGLAHPSSLMSPAEGFVRDLIRLSATDGEKAVSPGTPANGLQSDFGAFLADKIR